MPCPACGGRGGHTGLGCGGNRCGVVTIPCEQCKGAGSVTAERAAEIEAAIPEGQKLRADRVARGLSLRDEARRLGISVLELSQRERGLL